MFEARRPGDTERRVDRPACLRVAAREVLALVRPRRLPFGSNQASPADRDYLIALLESGYDDILLASQTRVSAALESAKREALSALAVSEDLGDAADDVSRTVGDAQRWVEAQVFARTAAFLRGYLRGGVVAEFFRRDLPKAELSEDAIYQALYRSSPDLDREIALPLAEAGITALDTLADRLDHFAQSAGVAVFDAEVGIELALEELSARLGKLSS